MSRDPVLAARATRILREDARQPRTREPVDDALVAMAAAEIRLRAARRSRFGWALRLGSAAALVTLLVGAGFVLPRYTHPKREGSSKPPAVAEEVRGGVFVMREGQTSEVIVGRAMRAADRVVVVPGGTLAMRLDTGTRLALEGGADVSVLEHGRANVFRLSSGALRAEVVKLEADERFVIHTVDAEIEVHGTSFRVSAVPSDPTCGAGTTTRVEVFEGVVSVRASSRESRISAGERWPSGCGGSPPRAAASDSASPPTETFSTPTQTPTPTQTRTLRAVAAPPPSAAITTAAGASTPPTAPALATDGELFDAALEAKRRGDAAGAIALLDRLLANYPGSRLSETARVERMRLLSGISRDRARAAAVEYLDAYPQGFARAEAKSLAFGER